MPFVFRGLLLPRRPCVDSALATVVAHTIFRPVYDRFVIDVVNIDDIHIRHRPVIEEMIVIPSSACEAVSKVAKPVVDAAVESDVWPPIASMEHIHSVGPTPIGRGPQEADFRGLDPSTGHPVVVGVVLAPGPIARRPNVAISGAHRLLVNGQRRRSDPYRNVDLSKRRRCHHQQHQREQGRMYRNFAHCVCSCRSSFALPGAALLLRAAWTSRCKTGLRTLWIIRLSVGACTDASGGLNMSFTGLFRERSLLRGCAKMRTYSTRAPDLPTSGEPPR